MATLGELALRRVHAGDTARSYELTINGEPFTQLDSAKADFDPSSGGSAMSISVRDSLEGLEDATVELRVGYGRVTVPYFIGKLQEPSDLRSGKATAYGAFKLMADQSFGEPVTYSGVTLRYIFKDLERRAGYGNGVLEIVGGAQTVEKLDYTEETRLGEAAKAITDPAKYVFFDLPAGKRRVMPEPRPGTSGTVKARYAEHNYGADGFKTKDAREGHYSKVVVFRRDSGGHYVVRQEAPVPNRTRFKPPANRIYYVPEFPGSAIEAAQTAYEVANRLAYGELEGELNDIWINPELALWDTITAERTERRPKRLTSDGRPGKWLCTYQLVIGKGLSLEITKEKHHMSLSGGAVKIAEYKLPDPIRLDFGRALSPGLIVAAPLWGLIPDVNLQPDDFGLQTDVNFQPDTDLQATEDGLQPDDVHFV